MTKRPGDTKPDPAGGRALERLRMFEEARALTPAKKSAPKAKATAKSPARKKRR
jgi:hypothetical protein